MEKKEKKITKKIASFEDALESLENIAATLESGTLGLDESISKYEEGMRYAKFCEEKLKEAEQKIEVLQKSKDGKVKKKAVRVQAFSGEVEDDEDLQGSLL